eukprot:15437038-Alexandrium_andersonii.AAC.1
MFIQKCESDFGWGAVEAAEEWKRHLDATDPAQIRRKPTLPGKKMEPWIYLHAEDVIKVGQGLEHRQQVQFLEKQKKNPTAEDIAEAEASVGQSGIDFSDNFFQKMSGLKQAIQSCGEASGSAIVDNCGRSHVFQFSEVCHRDRGVIDA